MKCSIDLPASGQRIAVPVLSTHTTPEQRSELLEQLARLRCYVYHVADIAASSKAPNGVRIMHDLTILNTPISQHEGLYSLNDLHRASGGAAKHQPALFVRLESTQGLIEELCSTDMQNINETTNLASKYLITIRGRGKTQGTYACKELVITYAAWISPAFHLKVIRVFLGSVHYTQQQSAIQQTLATVTVFNRVFGRLRRIGVEQASAAMRANDTARQVTGMNFLKLTNTTQRVAEKAREEKAANEDHPLVEAFWEQFEYLDGKYLKNGAVIDLNHSGDETIIAINLVEYEAACSKAGLHLPCELAALKKQLKTSVQRRFIEMKPIWSALTGRTVRCWLFQAGKPRQIDCD